MIAIIGILIALLLPAVQAARESARRTQCSNNLKQIGLGLQGYHDVYRKLPPGLVWDDDDYGWGTYILPFCDQTPLFDLVDPMRKNLIDSPGPFSGTGPGTNPPTISRWDCRPGIEGTSLSMFSCPSSQLPALCPGTGGVSGAPGTPHRNSGCGKTDYKGCTGNSDDGALQKGADQTVSAGGARKWINFSDFLDGTTNTILAGESSYYTNRAGHAKNPASGTTGIEQFPTWAGAQGEDESVLGKTQTTSPPKTRVDDDNFYSEHPGTVQFVFGDGSVKAIRETISVNIYRDLGSRQDGRPIPSF